MKIRNLFFAFCILLICLSSLVSISALSISVNVPEKYTEVEAGERFYFEIDVKYPENPERKDLKMGYEIVNKEGEVVAQSKVLKAIETQASFIDFIVIPEDVGKGMYILKVSVMDYGELDQEVEASFNITKKSDELRIYFIILIGVILFVGILIAFSILKKK